LFIESFDLRLNNQYILVRAIPSCFRFGEDVFMLGESSVEVQPYILDLFCSRELDIVDVNRGTRFSSRGECDVY
jgi:hypothetical protein